MAGPLLFCLLTFATLFHYYDCSETFDNLNITRTKTAQYDELYNDGLYAYNLKNFPDAVKYFEQAIADYKQQEEVKLHCRSKCLEKFRKSLGARNVKAVLRDLELEYFRLTIYSRKCSQICREKYLGKRSAVAAVTDEDFKNKRPYSFLQFSYYKTGHIIKAARAALTYLESSPKNELMLDNLKYYKKVPLVSDALLLSYEPIVHQDMYFKAVQYYDEQKWELAIESFEKTIKEYLKAFERCKLHCEEVREANKILGKSGLYGVYIDVLSCRSHCPIELSTIKGTTVDKYFARHYNYLQMSYYKADKMQQAAECATSYLLMDPDDDNMIDNLKFFRYWSGISGKQIQARQEIIDYHNEITMESKLLNLALVYTDEDQGDLSDELFEDANAVDTGEDQDVMERTTEDLVDGEETDYSSVKLSGLGPLRDPSLIKPIDEIIKQGKYKNAKVSMTEDQLNGTNRFVADGLITDDQCKTLMELARKTAKLGDGYSDRSMPDGRPFSFTDKETFEGVTPMAAVKAIKEGKIDFDSVDLYVKSSERMRDFVEDYFQLETPLYFSYSHLVCRTSLPGSKEQHISHPIHSDNCLLHNDGPGTCPKRSPAFTWRDYSALLYLNGDFEGGEFFFAHRNETLQATVKPTCGRLVAFSAGVENLHGVLGVEGRRCAIALWFTMRVKHDEQSRTDAKKALEDIRQKLVGKDNLKQQFADIQPHKEL